MQGSGAAPESDPRVCLSPEEKASVQKRCPSPPVLLFVLRVSQGTVRWSASSTWIRYDLSGPSPLKCSSFALEIRALHMNKTIKHTHLLTRTAFWHTHVTPHVPGTTHKHTVAHCTLQYGTVVVTIQRPLLIHVCVFIYSLVCLNCQ